MTTTKKYVAKRDEDGDYEYRGRRICRDAGVPNGYYGRWRIGTTTRFSTLGQAKQYVDDQIAKRESQP